ncbi:MAG: hypothetical protein V7709_10775 [Halioglobus sp.]
MIQRILGALLCVFAMLSWAEEDISLATGQSLVISSGVNGGGYWSAASRLQAVAEGKGVRVENIASAGSLANLEALADPGSPVNLAFAQADAVEYFLSDNPGARAQISSLENIGQECVFIITAAKSNYRTDIDLQKSKAFRLGIASHTSGVAVTFNYMTRRLPELSTVEVVYGDAASSIENLHAPAASLDAVMVVHRPREHSREVDLALGDPERYRFLEVGDNRLTGRSDRGQAVYRSMKLAMPAQGYQRSTTVNTICVKGLLLANREKLIPKQESVLADIVDSHWMEVYATQ